jgi:hypothetical protein
LSFLGFAGTSMGGSFGLRFRRYATVVEKNGWKGPKQVCCMVFRTHGERLGP